MASKLGKKLGVTLKDIARIRALETQYTKQAQRALMCGDTEEFQRLIEERDCQTAWLRAYA